MPACPECGERSSDRARFCWACGARITDAPLPRAGAERRLVTVLFVDLVGFTGRSDELDPEDVNRVLTPYYQRVRAELERFGGTVEKFIGDAVMALFGAPVAHEDDAERALRAAFAIRRAIDELNAADLELDLQVRIGVNTGEAYVDLDADPSLGEAYAAGDVVNTCFRLQQAATVAGILVGEATRRATEPLVEYRPVEPVPVKGKHQPVRAWEALSLRPQRARPYAPLVGRREELRLLLEAVDRAGRDAAPQLVTLVGEPGIGKTRLLWELYHALVERGWPFLWRQGRCLPYGEGVTFWAFAEIVKAHVGILETDAAEAAGAKLHAAVAAVAVDTAAAEWIEAHLRPLVGLSGSDTANDRRGEAFSAWRAFVEAVSAREPLVLAFEDLHWADEGLLDFIEHLATWARGARLALVCAARPELLERRPAWPGVVRVEPLSNEDTAELLRALLGDGELQPGLLARAGGNPLYAEEYARMLRDQPTAGEFRLPETVQAIIAARLDALPREAKFVLQDAAVVGKGFWVGALARLSGTSVDHVERRLAELQRKELVRPQPRTSVAGESQYAFWHVLVRDVAYTQIPRARRAEKHRLTAEWIESLAADRAEDLAEMLAHHYTSALEYARLARQETRGLEERARLALRGAGERALALYAFAAAARFFAQALEFWPEDDFERPQLLFRYGKALFWAESTGHEVLAGAREELLAAGDREAAAEADVMLSRLALARGDSSALELAERAAGLISDAPPSPAKGEALSNLARFLELTGRAEEAIGAAQRVLDLAEELGLEELRAHALYSRGCARVPLGDLDGIRDLERSIAITDRLNSPWSVRGYANLASLLANLGELDRAWPLYAEARRIAERFGDVRGLRWLEVERVFEHYWRGEWDDALAVAALLLSESEAGVEHYMAHGCWHVRACVRLARGDVSGALDDSGKALEFSRKVGDPQALYPSLGLRAHVLLAAGLADEAAAFADELLELWTAGGFQAASFWTAELAAVLWELGRGADLTHAALEAKVPTRWLEAACRFAEGRFMEASDVYAAIGALPEETLARLRAAEALAAAGRRDEADASLQQALAFFRRVSAEAYAGECEALLPARA